MAYSYFSSNRRFEFVLVALSVNACNLLGGKEDSQKAASSVSAPQSPVFVVASTKAGATEQVNGVATGSSGAAMAAASSAPPAALSDYSLEGIGELPEKCTDSAVVMMAVPKNYYSSDSFDWRHVRQVALANPEFEIVRSLSAGSKPQSIAFSENEHTPTKGIALVAHCKTAATCLKFAAAYRTVVPTAKLTPICGANPNIGARITGGKSVLPDSGRIADVLPNSKNKDAQSECVRLAACKAARDHVLSSDETQECMKKPGAFKLHCAQKQSCEQVLACSGS
jgi:hypothetical protein